MTTWRDLTKLAPGQRVRFTAPFYILLAGVDHVVSADTMATIVDQCLDAIEPVILLRPDDDVLKSKLGEWLGLVRLRPPADRMDLPAPIEPMTTTRCDPELMARRLISFVRRFAAYEFGKGEHEPTHHWQNRISAALASMTSDAHDLLDDADR